MSNKHKKQQKEELRKEEIEQPMRRLEKQINEGNNSAMLFALKKAGLIK